MLEVKHSKKYLQSQSVSQNFLVVQAWWIPELDNFPRLLLSDSAGSTNEYFSTFIDINLCFSQESTKELQQLFSGILERLERQLITRVNMKMCTTFKVALRILTLMT